MSQEPNEWCPCNLCRTAYERYIYLLQICQLFKKECFSGSKIYNHLPSNIKLLSKDIKEFKFVLKSYLTKHAYYSIDEYYK
jgi:hypothetical protein